ncbi:MAG: hypothetical protein QOJ89_3904, partial [bacterium]
MAVSTTTQVTLPAMGESVREGTVLEWHKREGDIVEEGETLVEVSTDKVDAEIPAPASGTVTRILAAAGETVAVGAVLAEIANGGPPSPGGNGAPASAPAAAPAAELQSPPQGELLDIVTPAGGESVTEGTILEWAVAVGDEVRDGQTIVELSTDKVDMELPAPVAGTITEILAAPGETVTVGQVIARMRAGLSSNGGRATSPAGGAASPAAGVSGVDAVAPAPAAPTAPPVAEPAGNGHGPPVSPVARRIAEAEGIDLSAVHGSGPAGRITKADVLSARTAPARPAAHAPAAPPGLPPSSQAIPLRGGAAVLARYMDESRQVPTATSLRTMTVTVMDARRRELKAAGHKLSFTHLIAYAIARAATGEMPVMANHFADIEGRPHRIDDGAVHLGIAVDVEKRDGSRALMVPVIRDAGRMTFTRFVDAFAALVAGARANTLTADELSGANISLTNPGGIGTIASVPRLMAGQGTIVATGAIGYPAGLAAVGDMIGAEKVMTMTSTYDHRVIQGAESGRFLAVVEQHLQGEHDFYEQIFGELGVALGPPPAPPAPAAAAAAAREAAAAPPPAAAPSEELLQAVQAASSLVKAHRTFGHLAARLDPLGTEPEGDPALDPVPLNLTPEIMSRIPAKILRMHVPGATLADALPHLHETYCGTIAYEIEHIASHRQRT